MIVTAKSCNQKLEGQVTESLTVKLRVTYILSATEKVTVIISEKLTVTVNDG